MQAVRQTCDVRGPINAPTRARNHQNKNSIQAMRMNSVLETDPTGIEETLSTWNIPPKPHSRQIPGESANAVYWSWACRKLEVMPRLPLEDSASAAPEPGDLALVRVDKIGFHKYLTTTENRRLRLYPGAQFIGVFGNRYASDAYEAEVQGTGKLSLLTGAGMIGTVKSKHEGMAEPTQISFVGFVRATEGRRLNLKSRLFRPATARQIPRNLIFIVGASMNSGKTTTAARLTKGLSELGLRVAACKLTGSVSNQDTDELEAAAARKVTDFSDFGFPSTYLCGKEELLELFYAMMTEVRTGAPDMVVMELADGLLQRETAMLLAEPEMQRAARGVVFTGESALSALWGAERLSSLGYRVVAVSGKFTSSPLAMREYTEHDSHIPVVSSAGTGEELAVRVKSFLSGQ